MLKPDRISYILNDPDAKFTNVKNDRIAEKLIFIAKTGLKPVRKHVQKPVMIIFAVLNLLKNLFKNLFKKGLFGALTCLKTW